MTTRKLLALVLGFAVTLLLSNYTYAMPKESQKETTEAGKEVIGTQPSMEDRKQAIHKQRKKTTVDNFFKELDGDKNSKVSLEEFVVPMGERFKSIDTNHDGFITREEFEISYDKHQKKRMQSMQKQPQRKMPKGMPRQMPKGMPGQMPSN